MFVRRVSSVDLMLLGTVLLWSLNITVTKYVFDHGFQPLAYGTIRYFAATSLFWCFTLAREGTVRVKLSDGKLDPDRGGPDLRRTRSASSTASSKTSAATVALILGTTPIFIGILATAIGLRAAVAPLLARRRDLVRRRRLRRVRQRRLLGEHRR